MGAEQKETAFYSDDKGVRITSSLLMVGKTTYAMANITSVSIEQDSPSYTGAGLVTLIGLVLFVVGIAQGSGVWVVGFLVLAGGAYWAYSLEPDYRVRVCSAAGESSPISTPNKAYAEQVVRAIHEAIIHRG